MAHNIIIAVLFPLRSGFNWIITILGILRFYWMEGNLKSQWPQMSSIWLLIYEPLPSSLGAEPGHPHKGTRQDTIFLSDSPRAAVLFAKLFKVAQAL